MNAENLNEKKQRILIIDDEVEITKALERQFKRKYTVFSANSALEASTIIEKEDIQVIISDQRMPGMTGIEFYNKIKTAYPDTVKIILTGYSDINNVIEAINQVQIFKYITKPWNPQELDWTINEAFEKYELQAKNKELLQNLSEVNANLEKKVMERTQKLNEINDALTEIIIENKNNLNIIEAIFNSIPGLIFLYNDENKLIKWNRKHVLMTGYSDNELLDKSIMDWFADDFESMNSVETILNNLALNGYGDAEVNFQKKNGTKMPLFFTASSVNISGSRYFAGIGINISERK